MAAVFDVGGAASGEQGGDVFELVAAAEVGAVADDAAVVEGFVVAVFGLFESVNEVGEECGAFLVSLA